MLGEQKENDEKRGATPVKACAIGELLDLSPGYVDGDSDAGREHTVADRRSSESH